ncbi:glycoside hydrolase family 16 protein [Zasmidium cellare ATCC 36951]|uniref:Glycoside hydrolase family 16 protein n=1 Tax=Zasmidium cellare ATCC 36951 TaxID=1080233 RepID=A0A6A6CR43_ZASCE|nr:glycoside hydrolase family 16 protein [Zasmidium cellare ATCC 36951]KAF2169634.1 glycoside hydrolase family 16 protein [Zasmidium cellare ATCC 36951]
MTVVSFIPIANAASLPRATGSNTTYKLIADYSGANFFDHFTFFTDADPTNGHVKYQSRDFAASNNLIGHVFNATSNATSAYIGVDHTNKAPTGRNSVRLISKDTFNAGSLAVIDTNHIPVADGAWPAIWLLGSQGTWPASGESDILEYVHETRYNAMTLHTAPGCAIRNASESFQGELKNADCNAGNAATGCSIAAYGQNRIGNSQTRVATAGFAFNKQNGGVYVHNWQPDGITVWMFPHGGLPKDLVAGSPNPSSWTQKPLAKSQGECDFTSAFTEMALIINIDFCGDWAGKTWAVDGAAQRTGVETCNEYVANHPQAFREAYFDIAGVRFYSNNGQSVKSKRHEGHEMPTSTLERSSTSTSDAETLEVGGWLAIAGTLFLIAYFL